jgi:hypothetical protein
LGGETGGSPPQIESWSVRLSPPGSPPKNLKSGDVGAQIEYLTMAGIGASPPIWRSFAQSRMGILIGIVAYGIPINEDSSYDAALIIEVHSFPKIVRYAVPANHGTAYRAEFDSTAVLRRRVHMGVVIACYIVALHYDLRIY